MENKRLAVTVAAFAGIVVGILVLNRWINGQIEGITKDVALERPAAPQQIGPLHQTAREIKPVFINPDRDPLKPVIPRKKTETTAKKAAPRQTNPQKIYEPAEASVILVQ